MKIHYKLLTNEKNRIIIVAEDECGKLLDFCSGTISAEEHLNNMKRNRLRIGFSMLPAIIKSPKIKLNIFGF